MAKAKTLKPLPLEERPAFKAAVAALPETDEELFHLADQMVLMFNDAALAGDETALEDAATVYQAVIYRMNGDTFFGCQAEADRPGRVMAARHTAPAGQVPTWGQEGEFLVTLTNGCRIRVAFHSRGLHLMTTLDLNAVDHDRPFVSNTGYRHHTMRMADHFGRSVAEAVRLEVEENAAQWGMVAIDHPAPAQRPAWLKAALAPVADDGQLAMFADQPAPKRRGRKPTGQAMTPAQRAEAYRKRQKEKREAEGMKPVNLTDEERQMLAAALALETALDHNCRKNAPARLALMRRLVPGRDWAEEGEKRAEQLMYRDNARAEAAYAKGECARAQAEANRQTHRADEAERVLRLVGATKCGEQWQGVEQLPADMVELLRDQGPVVVCLDAFTRLRKVADLCDHWEGEATTLRRQAKALERENELLQDERNKAFGAANVFQERLRDAGLSTDYRAASVN